VARGNLAGLLALLVSVARLQLGFPRGAGLALGFGGVALLGVGLVTAFMPAAPYLVPRSS
jgi:hypothetical protein